MNVHLKRVYDPATDADGARYLVDRLWPRGMRKESARLTGWLKELAPSSELRTWYGHQPERWDEFQRRYRDELRAPDAQSALARLREESQHQPVTLLTASRDFEHSDARVLQEMLERERS